MENYQDEPGRKPGQTHEQFWIESMARDEETRDSAMPDHVKDWYRANIKRAREQDEKEKAEKMNTKETKTPIKGAKPASKPQTAKETAIAKFETANLPAAPVDVSGTLYAKFQRDGKLLIASAFLPEHFNNPKDSPARRLANVCVAMELASHFKDFGPLQVIQQIYFVGGQPSWKSSFVISLLKSQGLKVTHEEEGDWEKPDENTRTRCVAIDKQGMKYASTWITPKLVVKEGWDKKPGSKWLSMPAQMARYRSAAFLARAYWPELLMGYYTTDERADFINGEPPEECYEVEAPQPAYTPPASVQKTMDYDYSNGPTPEQWDEIAAKFNTEQENKQ